MTTNRRPFQGSPTTRSQAQKTRSAGRRRGRFLIRLYTAGFYRPVGFRGERPSSLEECGRCRGGDGGNRGHERFEREAKSPVISFCTRLSRATGIDEAMLARFTVAPRHSVTALHGGKGRRARCGNSSPPAYHNTHAVCRKRTTATACERRSTSRVGTALRSWSFWCGRRRHGAVPYAAGHVASGRGSSLPHLRGNHPDWRRRWVRRTPCSCTA